MNNIKLAAVNEPENIEMRKVYCNTLMELTKENPSVVALDADLINSSGMVPFQKAFPDRMFNCGIQEANMIGVAAGLSAVGKIPFVHSFATFASRRCIDQVFQSCAYAKQNVKITGTDPGIMAEYNGGTHMPFEDIGMMRCIPEVTIVEPSDSTMMASVVKQMAGNYGTFYLRMNRKAATKLYDAGDFEIGKAVQLRDGKDATIIACGIMVAEALKAADLLKKEGIEVRVLDMFTIKPIDREAVVKAAEETGAIVTVENHNVINGLASAVSEVVVETKLVPMERVGIKDHFGEVGKKEYLKKIFHLTPEYIAEKTKKAICRK